MQHYPSLITLSLATLLCNAMQKETPASAEKLKEEKKTVTISERCYQELQNIDYDGTVLYYYLLGAFGTMAEKNMDTTRKPSDLLTFFADAKKSDIDKITQLKHMPATEYLATILSKHHTEFDASFKTEYEKSKDIQKTWKWFGDEYFKQKGIAEPLSAYKKQLAQANAERIELARKGIFFRGNTAIINPDLADDDAYPELKDKECSIQ